MQLFPGEKMVGQIPYLPYHLHLPTFTCTVQWQQLFFAMFRLHFDNLLQARRLLKKILSEEDCQSVIKTFQKKNYCHSTAVAQVSIQLCLHCSSNNDTQGACRCTIMYAHKNDYYQREKLACAAVSMHGLCQHMA